MSKSVIPLTVILVGGSGVGKTCLANQLVNKCFDEEHLNVKTNDMIEFITGQIDFELAEEQRYFSHIILSVVSDNQVQFDQQIILEFKYENNQLKYIGQSVSKFLELYDI